MNARDTMELREETIRAKYEHALGLLTGFDHAPRLAAPTHADTAIAAEQTGLDQTTEQPAVPADQKAIPIGILERAKVSRPIKAGQPLTYDACTPDDSMLVTQIRQRLDQSDAQFVTAA